MGQPSSPQLTLELWLKEHYATKTELVEKASELKVAITEMNGNVEKIHDRLLIKLGGLMLTCTLVLIAVIKLWP